MQVAVLRRTDPDADGLGTCFVWHKDARKAVAGLYADGELDGWQTEAVFDCTLRSGDEDTIYTSFPYVTD